jgi:hypothetical protein
MSSQASDEQIFKKKKTTKKSKNNNSSLKMTMKSLVRQSVMMTHSINNNREHDSCSLNTTIENESSTLKKNKKALKVTSSGNHSSASDDRHFSQIQQNYSSPSRHDLFDDDSSHEWSQETSILDNPSRKDDDDLITKDPLIQVSSDDAAVQMIRQKILSSSKRPAFDEKDISHFVLSCDVHILKYMDRFRPDDLSRSLTIKELDKAVSMMIDTLIWRKCSTLSSLTALSFPLEFYSIGGLFVYTNDKYDNKLLIFRLKMYQKIPELQEGMELFTTYKMYEAHNISVEQDYQGWCLVFDMTEVTMAQCDIPQLFWLINTFLNYFPKSLRQAYVFNINWVFRKIANFMMNFLPREYQEIVKFVSGSEIFDHFDKDQLPDFMGGTCEINYRSVPEGGRPVEDLAYEKYGMSKEDCIRIKKHFDRFLPEEYRVVKSETSSLTPKYLETLSS